MSAERCTCLPIPDGPTVPDSEHAEWMPAEKVWRWTCPHGHVFIRPTETHWQRLYTYDELKQRLGQDHQTITRNQAVLK